MNKYIGSLRASYKRLDATEFGGFVGAVIGAVWKIGFAGG